MKKILSTLLLVSILLASVPNQAYAVTFYSVRENISKDSVLSGISKQSFDLPMPTNNVKLLINHFIDNVSYYKKVPNSSNMQSIASDGTYNTNLGWSSKGCYHYADFVAVTMYGTKGERKYIDQPIGRISSGGLKSFLQKYAQAGEHLRIDNRHSLSFISSTDTGFYTLQYYGEGTDPFLSFSSYEYFADVLNSIGRDFFIFDSNNRINAENMNPFSQYNGWGNLLTTNDKNYTWTIKLNMPLNKSTVDNNSVYIVDKYYNKLEFINSTVLNDTKNGFIKLNNLGSFEKDEEYLIVVEDTIESLNNRKLNNGLVIRFVVK